MCLDLKRMGMGQYFRSLMTVLIVSSTSHSQAENIIRLSQTNFENSLYQYMARGVLKEAYSRINKEVVFENYPAATSLVIANSGGTDGELSRIEGINKKFSNLVMVPVSVAYEEVVVYSSKYYFKPEGWKSLKPYKIDFVKGFKLAEKNTKGMDVEMVSSIEQAIKKTSAGHSDLFIGTASLQCFLQKKNYSSIKSSQPAVDKLVMFHYLHKRHQTMANELESVLKQMSKNGEIKSIQEQAKQDLLSQCMK